MSLYFSTGVHGTALFSWYFTQPLVLLGLVLLALFDRPWLAFSVNAAVCLVFSWAQHWKLLVRGDPIYAEDLLIVGEAMQMAGQYIQITWSYARYFADQGYIVEGAHAGYEAFYNRLNVNENLGIPGYRFIEGYYDSLVDGIPMDDFFLKDITDHALAAMESGPVFSFNVTYQNHGPYSADYRWFPDEFIPLRDLAESDYYIANNYLWGIQDTARQMQIMLYAFRELEEPVILVFFGDHKPWMGDQSVTYPALGIDISSQSDESFFNYYATDYLFWANDAAKAVLGHELVGEGPAISPCFLMNVLFDQCGWEGPGYTKFTDAVMDATPLVHATKRYLTDGVLTYELEPEARRLVDELQWVQYYLAQDAEGVHP